MHTVDIDVAAQRQERRECRCGNARNTADRLQGLIEKLVSGCVGVELAAGFLDLHREELRRVESHLDGEDSLETAQQKARAHEKHERQRDFGDNERAADRPVIAR